MSIRIAFSGQAQAGKDMAAAHLLSQHAGELLKFADLLHEAVRPAFEKLGFSYEKDRELLQYIGMWARAKDHNVFARRVTDMVRIDQAKNYFVTDLRFPNEVDYLLGQDFVLVHIERKDLPEPNAEWRKHQSEHALDDFDGYHYRIRNCGSREHYFSQLDLLWRYVTQGEHRKWGFRTLTIE